MAIISKDPFVIYGKSEYLYKFTMYSLDHEFNDIPGTYMYVTIPLDDIPSYDNSKLIYCGETKELGDRIDAHSYEEEIMSHKPNCICKLSASSKEEAKMNQDDILEGNKFLVNIQKN